MLQKFLQNNFTLIEVLKEKVGDFALLKKNSKLGWQNNKKSAQCFIITSELKAHDKLKSYFTQLLTRYFFLHRIF